jgi:hypothetical protein
MYICPHRATSTKAEKAVGRIAKGGGWVSTACKDGVFLSSAVCLVDVNFAALVLMCLVCCAGGAGNGITEQGRFIDGKRRNDVVNKCSYLTTTQAKNCRLNVVVWKLVVKNCSFHTLTKKSHILQSLRYFIDTLLFCARRLCSIFFFCPREFITCLMKMHLQTTRDADGECGCLSYQL